MVKWQGTLSPKVGGAIGEENAIEIYRVHNTSVYFFHGVKMELAWGWLGEYWRHKVVGCLKWIEPDGTLCGCVAPFLDPFPDDEVLAQRRDEFLMALLPAIGY